MSVIGDTRSIARCRVARPCSWCAEQVEVGSPAKRYLCEGYGGLFAVLMHPECYTAMQSGDDYEDEWSPGSYARGCRCCNGDCQCEKPSETNIPAPQ